MIAPVKVALAGISGYGDHYLGALLPNEQSLNYELVGAVDPQPQRCKRLGELAVRKIPIYPTMDQLLAASAVDLMLIVTPTHLHSPQTCLALSRGAHVLCEKPVAGTVADAMRMLHAEEAGDRFVAIGYQWSFSDVVHDLKRDIAAGKFGRPVRLKTIALFPRPLSYYGRSDWAGRQRMPAGEGVFDSPVSNAAAHYLHNMLYLLGKTVQQSAMPATVEAELYRANDIENYDTAAMRCRTECGVELLFYASHSIAHRVGPRSWFEFEEATVEYDFAGAGEFIARYRDGRTRSYGQPSRDRHEKIWQAIDAVSNGTQIRCGIKGALPHALCAAAAQASPDCIATFPPHLKHRIPMDGDTLVAIEGLGEALVECCDANLLPSQAKGLFWSRPARVVTVVMPEGLKRRASAVALPA